MQEKIKIKKKYVEAERPLDDLFVKENSIKTLKKVLNLNAKLQTLTSNAKGITLIALIITIIVMLILVGVTVNVAINGGLFKNAKQATTETQSKIDVEKSLSNGRAQINGIWYDSFDDYLAEKESTRGEWILSEDGNTVTDGDVTLKIGDYVNYTYDKQKDPYQLPTTITGYTEDRTINQTTDLKWRILGVDTNGFLTLISDKPTSDITIGLNGAIGYNNGVYLLNDICAKQYSNKELEITARSLSIEDIESGFSQTGKIARDNYENKESKTQYKKTKTYTSSLNYPVIYAQENESGINVTEDKVATDIKKDGIGRSIPYYNENQLTSKPEGKESDTASGALTCTQTIYIFESTPQNYCKSSIFHNMIFGTSKYYWLASRYVFCYDR